MSGGIVGDLAGPKYFGLLHPCDRVTHTFEEVAYGNPSSSVTNHTCACLFNASPTLPLFSFCVAWLICGIVRVLDDHRRGEEQEEREKNIDVDSSLYAIGLLNSVSIKRVVVVPEI